MKLQEVVSVSALLVSGCGLIDSPSQATITYLAVKTRVQLITATIGNLVRPAEVQPFKGSGHKSAPLLNAILSPGMHQSVVIPSSADALRWLVIGTNFRSSQSLREKRLYEGTNSRSRI